MYIYPDFSWKCCLPEIETNEKFDQNTPKKGPSCHSSGNVFIKFILKFCMKLDSQGYSKVRNIY